MAEIVPFNSLDAGAQELIRASLSARERAYTPYSQFKVGCALQTQNGDVFLGCNVENTSYGLTICAERTALVSSVAAKGKQQVRTIAVSAQLGDEFVSPCGACRQFIAEFGDDITIYLARPQSLDQILKTSMSHLLPLSLSALQRSLEHK